MAAEVEQLWQGLDQVETADALEQSVRQWAAGAGRQVLQLRLDRLNRRWQQRRDHISRQLPRAA